MKTCTTCGSERNEDEFLKRGDGPGLRSSCKWCIRRSNLSRYHNKDSTRQAHREASRRFLLKKYGLTPASYLSMYVSQGSRCALCADLVEDPWELMVDHDHHTGATRGLLCRHCNSGLGFFRDDRTRLCQAINYLEANSEAHLGS